MCAMADHAPKDAGSKDAAAAKPAGSKKKLLLIAVPVLLLAAGGGAWFAGLLPFGHKAPPGKEQEAAKAAAAQPVYVDIPEIVTNLNVPGKRQTYLKLHAKLELPGHADEAGVAAAMPRILDLFQTYLRDMRPEDLRGSEGSYRLREELIGRATVAVAPAHVSDVLFVELLIE